MSSMCEIYEIVLNLRPFPFKSPEFTGAGAFDPIAKQKALARWMLKSQIQKIKHLIDSKAPIDLDIEFHFQPAKSLSKVKRQALLASRCHDVKPDADNLEKALFDILKRDLFDDDCQIWRHRTTKIWSEKDQTVIKIIVDKKQS